MAETKEYCPKCKKEKIFCTCESPRTDVAKPERKMFTLPRREFPKVFLGENECHICGMPLKDSTCPMCGWTPGAPEPEATYRCPFCGIELISIEKCPSCGKDLQEFEKEKKDLEVVIECSCPICLKEISVEDDLCPHCNAQIWLDVEKELESLHVLKCPKCQTEISEDVEKCPECGFEVWFESKEDLLSGAIEIMKEAETQLNIGREEGANLDRLANLLAAAKEDFDKEDYRKARKTAKLVLDAAKTKTLQLKMFEDALRKAERLYEEVNDLGDVSEITANLDYAKTQAEIGEYKNALKLAIKASIVAEKLKGQKTLGMIEDYK